MFKNSADQLHVIQVADHHVIFIARNKIKKTSEWINTNQENFKMNKYKSKKAEIYHELCEKKYDVWKKNHKYKQF